ncbi:MAG: AAA family ATPase, partial [Chloroflexales bacterium]|nr:AAA family ATPase [Chloroflexales bacterium]
LRSMHAAARTGAVAGIEGQPGIGKTRLAEDLLASARAMGAPTFAARCYEGEAGLAYAPVAALLREATAALERSGQLLSLPHDQLAEVARLVPALARRINMPEASLLAEPDARRRFFEAVADLLIQACDGRAPGVLLLDDVHWADTASLDLIAFLARRARGRPGLLLLTWRGEDVPTDHSLRALLGEARRHGAADQITLGGLSAAAVGALARAHNANIPPDVVERLHRESEGLPLLVVEYLAALDEGVYSDDNHPWPLPTNTRDLMMARLRPLPEPAHRLLLAAAAIGRSFDVATLCAAADMPEDAAVDALEQLVARGLVAETDPATVRYDFSHGKLRGLILDSTSKARQRLVHRRVADYLAGVPGTIVRPGVAARIAYHYEQAGSAALAAEHHRRAGDQARALYANGEALAHYAAALAAGHPEATALHEAMGDLHALAGNYQAALKYYGTAQATGGQTTTIDRKLGELYHRLGDWDAAEAQFAAALADSSEPAERALALAAWSLTARRRGDLAQAATL